MRILNLFAPALLLVTHSPLSLSAPFEQYATSVIAFSSEYSAILNNYSAKDALGAPNVTIYGDSRYAWTPATKDGTLEYISLGYTTPVYSYGATIRENSGPGMVYKVDLRDTLGVWRTVWQGKDPSPQGAIANFFVSWPVTTYKVNGIKIYTNTNATSAYEEIDSVQLTGVTTNTPAVSLVAADTLGSEAFSSTAVFVVTRYFSPLTQPLTVQYTVSGTAINGIDYNATVPLSGTVTIPAGARSAPIFVTPVNDTRKEISETVNLRLISAGTHLILPKQNTASVTINSDE